MNKSETKILAFFNLIGNPTPLIATSLTKAGMKMCSLKEALAKNNEDHDCYFVVNPSSSFKNEGVKKLVTNFVDLDSGKDESGKYKTPAKVTEFKRKAIKRIKEFNVKPTAVVETRNGYQVYYAYQTPVAATAHNRSLWEKRQNHLFNFYKDFGCDRLVLKPNQLLRIPYTLWHKKWSGNYKSHLTALSVKGIKIDAYTLPVSDRKEIDGQNPYSYKKSAVPAIDRPHFEGEAPIGEQAQVKPEQTYELASLLSDISAVLYAKGCKYLANAAKNWSNKLTYG